MNSTAQTLTDPAVRGSTVAVSASDVLSTLRRYLAAPIKSTSEAVVDAVRYSVPGIYAMAPANEADRQIDRLNALRGAGNGWAGPGSIAPNAESLDAAIDLIRRLKHLPLPTPMASIGSHGNAGLFWSDAHLYADIELLDDGRIGYLLHVPGTDEIDNEEDVPPVGLPPTIAQALATAYLSNNR